MEKKLIFYRYIRPHKYIMTEMAGMLSTVLFTGHPDGREQILDHCGSLLGRLNRKDGIYEFLWIKE